MFTLAFASAEDQVAPEKPCKDCPPVIDVRSGPKVKHPRGYLMPSKEELDKRHVQNRKRTGPNPLIARLAASPTWDCRALGQCGPVGDQASCGDCHDHSAKEVVEDSFLVAGWFKAATWQGLSIQQLLDCADTGGCNGGDEWTDTQWIIANGLAAATDYPGPGQQQGKCQAVAGKTLYKPVSQQYVSATSGQAAVADIKMAIVTFGPVSSAVAAGDDWDAYQAGQVLSVPNNPSGVDHAVLIIGWNDTISSFLVQNSWGTSWGSSGTCWIKYNCESIGTEAFTVTAPPGPAPVTPPAPVGATTFTLNATLSAGTYEVAPAGTQAAITRLADDLQALQSLSQPKR